MKIYHWTAGLAVLSGMFFQTVLAEETAVVTQKNVNVRGQPSLYSEVITHLKQGDKVMILEEITPEKPKPGDPDKWARIKLPEDTHVWVFAAFLKEGMVNVTKLNMRGGPGENFSVLGRLKKGDPVKSLRTLGDWTEIEAPEAAAAYVAFEVLKRTESTLAQPGDTNAVNAAEAKPSVLPLLPVLPKPATTNSVPAEPKPQAKSTSAQPEHNPFITRTSPPFQLPANARLPLPKTVTDDAAPVLPQVVNKSPAAVAPQPAAVVPAAVVPSELKPKQIGQIPPPPKPVEELPAKRIVRREGVVRSALSIQAPTPFELVSTETRRSIDYLHAEKSGLTVKHFKGQRVVVTGEEGIDPRWPNTPVLEIETIDSAP